VAVFSVPIRFPLAFFLQLDFFGLVIFERLEHNSQKICPRNLHGLHA
jgi:hypothetical protein